MLTILGLIESHAIDRKYITAKRCKPTIVGRVEELVFMSPRRKNSSTQSFDQVN